MLEPLASESCLPDASCRRAADRECRALAPEFTHRISAIATVTVASESCRPDASCSRAADRGCRALVLAFTQRIRAACHVRVILGCPRLCGFARIHSPPCLPLLHIVSPAASPSCLFGALVFCSCGFKAHGIISIVYWAHCKRIPRLQTLTCSESRVQTLTCSESRVFMAIVSGCPRLARRLAGAAL